jgi:hypothetical protein
MERSLGTDYVSDLVIAARAGDVAAYLAWADRIVTHLGGDPTRHVAMGVGYGLERFAMLRYAIDDIRKIDVARVA